MLGPAPLPAWRDLLAAPFRRWNEAVALGGWTRPDDRAGLLSQSAWSLALIAVWRQRLSARDAINVWVPFYFCDSSLWPLRLSGANLVFYPVTETLRPDYVACRQLALEQRPDVFVLVHYFGQPIPTADALEFCRQHSAWLVEDAAHVLAPIDGVGLAGHFVLYSPHKLMAVPDGAVLVARPLGDVPPALLDSIRTTQTWPLQLKGIYGRLKRANRTRRGYAVMWLGKRLLQKAGVRRRALGGSFHESEGKRETSGRHQGPPSASRITRALFPVSLSNAGAVGIGRRRRALVWASVLKRRFGDMGMLLDGARWPPYVAVTTVGDVARAAEMFSASQADGMPVMAWPDLPCEAVQERHGAAANAWQLRHSRLFWPVHDSISEQHITRAAKIVPAVARAGSISWDCSREEWDRWIGRVSMSNVLQTWGYGDAKSDVHGFSVRRAVIRRDGGDPIAIAQVLDKTYFGLARASRVNRGPLMLSDDPDDISVALTTLASLGQAGRGRVLSIAPELIMGGDNLLRLTAAGLRPRSIQPFFSGRVDLEKDLAELRSGLNRKRIRWVQQLDDPASKGLELTVDTSDESFEWLIEKYGAMMDVKASGIDANTDLLRALRRYSGNQSALVFRALLDGEPVSGVSITVHGTTATYQFSWNGDEGRKLTANSFLFWRVITYLKQRGYRWLDMNGINDVGTPGIAAFKMGFGPEVYELAGEYWKA